MKQLVHSVLIIADNADVFGGTIIDEVPTWAKNFTFLCGFSDYDALIDLVIARQELMRQSAPHQFAADNVIDPDLKAPHCIYPVDRVGEFPINCNFNVITGGTGLAIGIYSS